MKGTMLIYRPEVPDQPYRLDRKADERREFDHAPKLDELKRALNGGWLESVPYFDTIEFEGAERKCWVLCDEEGKLKDLAYNKRATALWATALMRHGMTGPMGDVLCGPVVVLFGDDEFMEAL